MLMITAEWILIVLHNAITHVFRESLGDRTTMTQFEVDVISCHSRPKVY